MDALREAATATIQAWDRWRGGSAIAPSPELDAAVDEQRAACVEADSCSYDEDGDPWDLTLENFLVAEMASERLSHDGWGARERAALAGQVTGPGDLEERIAPLGQSPEIRASQLWGLVCRYRHLLEHMIVMYGGNHRVWQHYCHLRECRRHGRLSGPPPPIVSHEETLAAVAEASWAALTAGLA